MQATTTAGDPVEIQNLAYLSTVLSRVDGSAVPLAADQYRALVVQLQGVLAAAPAGPALEHVLGQFPTTAALYENLHYAQAGLCRSPLDASLQTERLAVQAIVKAMKR